MEVGKHSVVAQSAAHDSEFHSLLQGKCWQVLSYGFPDGDLCGAGIKDRDNRAVRLPRRVEQTLVAYFQKKDAKSKAAAKAFFRERGVKGSLFERKWQKRAGKIGGFIKLRLENGSDSHSVWRIAADCVKHRYVVEWHCVLPDDHCIHVPLGRGANPQNNAWFAHATLTDTISDKLQRFHSHKTADWLKTPESMPAFERILRSRNRGACMRQLRDLLRTTVTILNPDADFDDYLDASRRLTVRKSCEALEDSIEAFLKQSDDDSKDETDSGLGAALSVALPMADAKRDSQRDASESLPNVKVKQKEEKNTKKESDEDIVVKSESDEEYDGNEDFDIAEMAFANSQSTGSSQMPPSSHSSTHSTEFSAMAPQSTADAALAEVTANSSQRLVAVSDTEQIEGPPLAVELGDSLSQNDEEKDTVVKIESEKKTDDSKGNNDNAEKSEVSVHSVQRQPFAQPLTHAFGGDHGVGENTVIKAEIGEENDIAVKKESEKDFAMNSEGEEANDREDDEDIVVKSESAEDETSALLSIDSTSVKLKPNDDMFSASSVALFSDAVVVEEMNGDPQIRKSAVGDLQPVAHCLAARIGDTEVSDEGIAVMSDGEIEEDSDNDSDSRKRGLSQMEATDTEFRAHSIQWQPFAQPLTHSFGGGLCNSSLLSYQREGANADVSDFSNERSEGELSEESDDEMNAEAPKKKKCRRSKKRKNRRRGGREQRRKRERKEVNEERKKRTQNPFYPMSSKRRRHNEMEPFLPILPPIMKQKETRRGGKRGRVRKSRGPALQFGIRGCLY